MFNLVIRTKLNPNWARVIHLLCWGVALVLFLCSRQVLAAPESSDANGARGESWAGSSSAVPTAGTVATAPAAAPGVTPATTPTSPSAPTQVAPAKPAPQPTVDEAADADPEALTLFRPQLDPYGTWVDDARYGRVWVPNKAVVGDGFSPYVTSGHWALDSDDNWIWVSDHPFGWVVFHYGRWFYSTAYGWAWVPGRAYAPNWVVWRLPTSTYAYVGWAPMAPRYGWFGGGAVWYSSYGTVSYVFCPSDYLFYPSVGFYLAHDPLLVARLGIYTSFYYPPYYYGSYYGGYYGHPRGYHRDGHAGYRPPAYGPPIHRTRISPRAIPRERVAADPRALAAAPRATTGATSGFSGLQRSPVSRASNLTRVRSTPEAATGARSTPRTPSATTTSRRTPSTVSPAVPRSPSSAPSATPTPRSAPTTVAPDVPRTVVPRSSPVRTPQVRNRGSSVRSAPTLRSFSGSGARPERSLGTRRKHR